MVVENSRLLAAQEKLEKAKKALSYDPAVDQTSAAQIMDRLKELHSSGVLTYEQYCDIFDEFRDPATAIRADMALVNKLTEMGVLCSLSSHLVDLVIAEGRQVAAEYQPS